MRVFHNSLNVAGIGLRAAIKKRPPHRRARALACHTRRRAGFPRHRPCTPTRAGDRPPRYGKKRHCTVGRGPVPRHRFAARPCHPCRSGSPEHVCDQAITNYRWGNTPHDDGDRGGQAPALRKKITPAFHRRARACPSPAFCCQTPSPL